jgi:hypothetical protein
MASKNNTASVKAAATSRLGQLKSAATSDTAKRMAATAAAPIVVGGVIGVACAIGHATYVGMNKLLLA